MGTSGLVFIPLYNGLLPRPFVAKMIFPLMVIILRYLVEKKHTCSYNDLSRSALVLFADDM